jgi:hypothetical protein
VPEKKKSASISAAERKKKRDDRVAAISLHRVPQTEQRYVRALNQALVAGELYDVVLLCANASKFMPLAALLRSLIDTCVLGIWFLKYANDVEIAGSVAHLSIPEMVKMRFISKDQNAFAFMFEPVKGTDHEFYRDVLHPSIHGDGLHIAMRLRDDEATKTWVHKCLFHSSQVYIHLTLQFAESGLVPANLHDYFQKESLKSLQNMEALLKHPMWQGTSEQLF